MTETALMIILFLIVGCIIVLLALIVSIDTKVDKLIKRFNLLEIDMMEKEIKEEEYKWAPKGDKE